MTINNHSLRFWVSVPCWVLAFAGTIFADDRKGWTDTFEAYTKRAVGAPWMTEGAIRNGETIGIDINRGFASHGKNNAFIRMPNGWNALSRYFNVFPNATYTISANIRTSPNVNAVYMGLRGPKEKILGEIKLGPSKQYQKFTVNVKTGGISAARFFIGYWAPGADSWIQVDDISITTTTGIIDEGPVLVPADE